MGWLDQAIDGLRRKLDQLRDVVVPEPEPAPVPVRVRRPTPTHPLPPRR